jgi:hypothetical protein
LRRFEVRLPKTGFLPRPRLGEGAESAISSASAAGAPDEFEFD